MKNSRLAACLLLAAGSISLTTGCSSKKTALTSGSAAGASVSFSLPSSVDVLKVDTSSGSSLDISTMAYNDAGTDYANQPQGFHVSHPVGEALATTSSIMCFIGQLGVGEMWSETALPRTYLVNVDDSKCESDSGQPSQGAASGGGSATTATQLVAVTVRLSREAAGQYPRAEFWFTESDGPGGSPMEIRASIDVIQAPDSTYPYGKFNLYFAMVANGEAKGGGNLLVSGSAAAPIAFTFFEQFSEQGQTAQKGASVEMQADGSGLKAAVESQNPWDGNSAWVVGTSNTSVKANNKTAANASATAVTEVDLTGGVCLSTDNYKYRIHGYGLYNETDGSKVTLNTGVSCQYTDSSGASRNCHISRHGAWFENETSGSEHTFANGDTVTRRSWGSDAATDGQQLTLFVSAGRLMKYTVKKYTLAEIRGTEMRMYDNSNNTEYIIKYLTTADSTPSSTPACTVSADGFYKVATMAWSQGGPPSKTDIACAQVSITAGTWNWFYSDSLGGVSFIGGNTFVTARVEQMVAPGNAAFSGGTLALKCLNRCPKSAISAANLQSWAGPYETDPANLGAAISYLVTESDLVLHKGTLSTDPAVELASGVTFTDGSSVHQWGVESGAMVTTATHSGLSNLWDIYDTAGNTYFQYRMGPNNWDKTVLAKDPNNAFLAFDEPLSFDYTHSTANDRNGDSTFNGKKFLLRYHGEGHIEGFPWDQVDRDGDGTDDMWFPQVSLKDAVQLTSGADNYRLKAMYGDITLTSTGADCSAITTLSLPTTGVPAAKAGNPSNLSTDKPDHAGCQYDSASEAASDECT